MLRARLGAEGIACQLDPSADGPYPLLPVEIAVYVREDQLRLAREILLADAVDAAFSEPRSAPPRKSPSSRWRLLRRREGR